jgi:hypothetical protein
MISTQLIFQDPSPAAANTLANSLSDSNSPPNDVLLSGLPRASALPHNGDNIDSEAPAPDPLVTEDLYDSLDTYNSRHANNGEDT